MTPLAMELARDVADESHDMDSTWRRYWRDLLCSAHFFQMFGVSTIVEDLSKKMLQAVADGHPLDKRRAFLPAPTTWVELSHPDMPREDQMVVTMIGDADRNHDADCYFLQKVDGRWCPSERFNMPLIESAYEFRPEVYKLTDIGKRADNMEVDVMLFAMLALINTPRVIGRRQHMPHERAERERLKAMGLVGKFPLRAWTELTLHVSTDDRSGDPSVEAHLTGDKCLHFCRQHLRVKSGRVEIVHSHWRGNPALGMKRTRYRVTP